MRQYPNFYECIEEARARLYRTIVMYDNLPYYVLAIFEHSDGIFRMYLKPIDTVHNRCQFMKLTSTYSPDYPPLQQMLDDLLRSNPDANVMRKMMNSPKFNRFRPFPLGMCNVGTQCYYVERQPIRPQMYQGLIKGGCYETLITAGSRATNPKRTLDGMDIYSPAFKDCILGDHHTAGEVIAALNDPAIDNDAHAFHREFAFVRGPLGLLFLGYRTDVIGILPFNSLEAVRLGKEFTYCREVVEELGIFERVICQK